MHFLEQSVFLSFLNRAIENLDLDIDNRKKNQLYEYCLLFFKWNKAYNLSAIREPQEFLIKHIFDSLSIVPFIDATSIIDVGTGGGLPGIPLAIIFPEKKISLLDSAGKKTRFLFQVKTQLKLQNVSVHHCRVENFKPEEQQGQKFTGVISRAFASLKDMTFSCHHLLERGGVFYAMKGIYPKEELEEVVIDQQDNPKQLSPREKRYIVHAYHKISVPLLDAERCLIILKDQSEQLTASEEENL